MEVLLYNCLVSPFTPRTRAESVKNTAETVKQALEDAHRAQAAAEKAIQRAKSDIGQTEDRLAQVKQSHACKPPYATCFIVVDITARTAADFSAISRPATLDQVKSIFYPLCLKAVEI